MKKKRIVILIVSVVLLLAAILFVFVFLLSPVSKKYTPKPFADNTARNGFYCEVLGTEGKVYYRAYNKFPFAGIYEYSREGSKRVYTAPLSIHPDVPLLGYTYRGDLLGELTSENGEFFIPELLTDKRVYKLDCPKGEAPESYFTTGGELYYYTVKKEDSQFEKTYSEDYVYTSDDITRYEGLYLLTDGIRFILQEYNPR